MSLLRVENLSIRFGGIKAVDGVGFEVNQGEVFTIIGPNGAGKTTIFNLLSRIYPPTSGRMLYRDTELTRLPWVGHQSPPWEPELPRVPGSPGTWRGKQSG